MNYVIKIILVTLLGTIFCGFFSGVWWYFVGYNYYSYGFFSKEGSAAIGAVIGLFCGFIGGIILSPLIFINKVPKVFSFILGMFINGIVPVLFFITMASGDLRGISEAQKDIWLSLLGQPIVGGITGILVSILANKQQDSLN